MGLARMWDPNDYFYRASYRNTHHAFVSERCPHSLSLDMRAMWETYRSVLLPSFVKVLGFVPHILTLYKTDRGLMGWN